MSGRDTAETPRDAECSRCGTTEGVRLHGHSTATRLEDRQPLCDDCNSEVGR